MGSRIITSLRLLSTRLEHIILPRPVLVFATITVFTVIVFSGLWHGYFQQDEWNGFGKVFYAQKFGYETLIRLSGNHLTPLSALFMALLFNLFSFNHAYYAWYSIFFHALNGLLVYLLAQRVIANRRVVALYAALLFITLSVSRQAVTWYAASMSVLPAASFFILGILAFEKYLKKARPLFFATALVATAIGLGFRENGVFLLGYFPLRAFLRKHPKRWSVLLVSAAIAIFYLLLRFVPAIVLKQPVTGIGYANTGAGNFAVSSLKLILVSVPQLVVPKDVVIPIGYWLDGLGLLSAFPYYRSMNSAVFVETSFLKFAYTGLFLLLAVLFRYLLKNAVLTREERVRFISLVLFLPLSIVPFSFLRQDFMESRHYYVPAVGYSLLVSSVFMVLLRHRSRFIHHVAVLSAILYLGLNMLFLKRHISGLIGISSLRRSVITTIQAVYPDIPEKAVFLGRGDPLPFQSGTGHMLLMLFHDQNGYEELLNVDFLWGLDGRGYAETETAGFGYFTDYDTFAGTYCRLELMPENAFSFSWNAKHAVFKDTSDDIRRDLRCI